MVLASFGKLKLDRRLEHQKVSLHVIGGVDDKVARG
jgi:hypothetical protein